MLLDPFDFRIDVKWGRAQWTAFSFRVGDVHVLGRVGSDEETFVRPDAISLFFQDLHERPVKLGRVGEALPEGDERLSLVVLSQDGEVEKDRDFLKPGGYLLIMTDNFDSRMAKSLGAGFPKWIPHSHISHFSALTLRKTLEETGKLELVKSMSYTPWEILLRNVYYKVRGITKTPSEAFNFSSTMENEMKGTYRFFALRKLFNKAFVKLTLSSKMDGDLMYFLCKKIA